MKKSLLSLVGMLAISATAFCTVNAQLDISTLFYDGLPLVEDAYTKILNDYEKSWGYINSSITCEVNNGVTITTPIVEDSTIDKASTYDLFISPYRLDQLKDGDTSIDTSKIIMKKVEINDNDENVKFEIPANELNSNTAYYGFVSPIDSFDEVGTPTKEICFKVSNKMCLQDTACDTLDAVADPEVAEDPEVLEMHGSAKDCVGMDMAAVSHTINGDTITLKWTAVEGDTVSIAILDPEKEIYKSLGTVKMSDEKFEYKMKWDGEQNFELDNGCKALRYKADAKATKEEPEIKVTPATGPAENILYIAIAAIVLYGAYTVFFRKSDN